MEDPAKEIEHVVHLITSPDRVVQKDAVLRYYAPDAAFRYPLWAVAPSPGSRDAILAILQSYRALSPALQIEILSTTYNAATHEAFLAVAQVFHLRVSPLRAAPARLLLHLVLRPSAASPARYQIALHEDFYHPGDAAALLAPPLVALVALLQKLGAAASVVSARLFALLGVWSVEPKGGEGEKTGDGGQPADSGSSTDADAQKSKTD